jgi:eukaryotic-like serine/threonine-protein kinase
VTEHRQQTADLGEIIGGYRLERPLGRGGMGSVFAASHVKLGRAAAVKVISGRFANDEGALARFLREAKAVNDVQHPNIVDIFDFVEVDNPRRVACIMEYLDGPSLKEVLLQGALSPRQAVNVTLQLASALEAVHALGIVHLDLKPANIVVIGSLESDLAEVPSVKLLDFGAARVLDGDRTSRSEAGTILGTPAYIAPEQIGGGAAIGANADVYALAEVLY